MRHVIQPIMFSASQNSHDFLISPLYSRPLAMVKYMRFDNKGDSMADNKVETKSAKDSIVEALEEQSIGKPDAPTLPLVGSENVPITTEEEKDVES